jgi:hypothetical protein
MPSRDGDARALRFVERSPHDRAELSEETTLPLAKADGREIAGVVFGDAWDKQYTPEIGIVLYRTIIREGTHLVEYPGILFDPPLAVDELISVELIDRMNDGAFAWCQFPRVLKPLSDDAPPAMVTRLLHRRLSDPLANAIAIDVFGKECISRVPLMPDGEVLGTLEFSLVASAGQPVDYDLDPPLARGEVIELFLRAPRPGTVARIGKKGPKRPVNSPVGGVQYPRVMFPFGEQALAEFLAAAVEDGLEDEANKRLTGDGVVGL